MTALTPVISGNTHSAPAATQGAAPQPRATGAGASAAAATAVTTRPVSATDCRLEKALIADKQALIDIITAYEASLDGRPNFFGSDQVETVIKDQDFSYAADSALGIHKITAPGENIIGFFIIEQNNKRYELSICIHPNHQGKGIGTQMTDQLLSLYSDQDTLIISEVDIRNTAALLSNFKVDRLNFFDTAHARSPDDKHAVIIACFSNKKPSDMDDYEPPQFLFDLITIQATSYLNRLEDKATRDEAIRALSKIHTQLNTLPEAEKEALFEDSDDDE